MTIDRYTKVVRRFLLAHNMQFNIDSMNKWLTEQNRNKSTYQYKYALKHFLLSLGRKDLAEQIAKAKKQQRKKVFKYVEKETMERIINTLTGVFKKMAFLQLKTGARFSEIATIRAENIDFNIHPTVIYIKIGVNKSLTKGSKERNLKISKKYEHLLRKWISKPWGYIFLDQKCETYTDKQLLTHLENIRRYYDKELNKAGSWHNIDALSSHSLRHIYADYFLKAGGDPIYLKNAMGHSKLDTTLGYVSIDDRKVDEVINRMEGI
jgi:integrase